MSKKRARLSRRNRARSRSPERARNALTSPPAPTGNEGDPQQLAPGPDLDTPLTFRQQSALPTIAAAPSIAQAARDSGIGESTIRRWLEDEDFRYELTRVRQEQADFANTEIQGLLTECVKVFSEAMKDPSMAIRLRAARYAYGFGNRAGYIEKLRADVEAIEQASTLDPPGIPRK